MSRIIENDLDLLQQADAALYMLWRETPIDDPLSSAITELQRTHLHPAIRRIRAELYGTGKSQR
jgi:hypothetical protein